jgi:hypothetical protein
VLQKHTDVRDKLPNNRSFYLIRAKSHKIPSTALTLRTFKCHFSKTYFNAVFPLYLRAHIINLFEPLISKHLHIHTSNIHLTCYISSLLRFQYFRIHNIRKVTHFVLPSLPHSSPTLYCLFRFRKFLTLLQVFPRLKMFHDFCTSC